MKKWVVETTDGVFEVVGAQGFVPSNARVPVPGSISKDDYSYVKAQEQLIEGEMRWVAYVDEAEKTAGEAIATKAYQKDSAYENMVTDVYDNLYTVFRTKSPATAAAEYETWKHMKDSPELYSTKGLKCDHQLDKADTTELFSPGSVLDTDQKILDYATRKIEQAHEYGIYRAERKQQFKDELASIEGA